MFNIGDRVVYSATARYRGDGFTQFEGVKGTVIAEIEYGCQPVMFDGQNRTWAPAVENLHLVKYNVVWEV